jgi:alginate O-acetyltransferase complex protein AlgI
LGADLLLSILVGYKYVFLLVVLGYLVHWIPERIKQGYRNWFASRSFFVMGLFTILAVFLMYQLMSGDMQPFIYFQF